MHFQFPFSKNEKYFVLEVLPQAMRGTIFTADADRRLNLKKRWIEPNTLRPTSRFARFRTGANYFHGTVVVGADPSLAYTTVVPIFLARETPKEPLTAIELENLLSQAVGRLFNQCRDAAAQALGIEDIDAILVNSRVVNFKVDGHRVINPVGFTARTVEAVFDLTLTSRRVFDGVRAAIGGRNEFFFTEIGRAGLTALRAVAESPINLLLLGTPNSSYFVLRKAAVGFATHRGTFAWRPDSLRNALADAWALPVPAADALYHAYLTEGFSKQASQAVLKILKPPVQAFFKRIEAQRLKGTVYVSSPLPFPFKLPIGRKGYTLAEPPLSDILGHFGFTIGKGSWPTAPHELFRALAPFLEFYYDKSDSSANQWLRRHLQWLGSTV